MGIGRVSLIVFAFTTVFSLGLTLTPAYAAGILYGLDSAGANPSTLYQINTLTGAATPIGATGFLGCGSMDYDPIGNQMYALCGNQNSGPPVELITIDLTTGTGTLVAPLTGATTVSMSDMSFRNGDNVLYVIGGTFGGIGLGTVYTLDKTNGILTILGATGTNQGNGIAFSPTDSLFHSHGSPGDLLNVLNQNTGAPTLVAAHTFPFSCPTSPRIGAMDFMPGSSILFGALNCGTGGGSGPIHLVTVDQTTAVVTNIGVTVSKLDAIAFVPDSEPITSFGDFKCWEVPEGQGLAVPPALVSIRDQFGIIENSDWSQVGYCTAATKFIGAEEFSSPFEPDLNQHYQGWFYPFETRGPGTDETVILNVPQFDHTFSTILLDLDSILVPATKFLATEPVPIIVESVDTQQHWNCYNIEESSINVNVDIITQHGRQNADVLDPFLLCAPMIKTDQFEPFDVFGTLFDEHMVCYDLLITPNGAVTNLPMALLDQLTPEPYIPIAILGGEETLCVPAFKSFPIVGGINIPIDTSALLLAGVQSISMWMIPVVVAGIGIGVFVIKRKK